MENNYQSKSSGMDFSPVSWKISMMDCLAEGIRAISSILGSSKKGEKDDKNQKALGKFISIFYGQILKPVSVKFRPGFVFLVHGFAILAKIPFYPAFNPGAKPKIPNRITDE